VCTCGRSIGLPDNLSARYHTVRARDSRLYVRLPVLTSFVRFVLGILIVLLFDCMTALFNPVHRGGERINWVLASYTMIMFSLVTALTTMKLNFLSISYTDNREYPGVEGKTDPGPYGYLDVIYANPVNAIPNIAFCWNN